MTSGILDTNILISALMNDSTSAECGEFVELLQRGDVSARLHVLVLHELTYALTRALPQMTRSKIATYILEILSWRGIECDVPLFLATAEAWGGTAGLSFVDAYLGNMALRDNCSV